MCTGVLALCLKLIVKYGSDYVDLPRLAAKVVSEATAKGEEYELDTFVGAKSGTGKPGKSAQVMPESVGTFGRKKES